MQQAAAGKIKAAKEGETVKIESSRGRKQTVSTTDEQLKWEKEAHTHTQKRRPLFPLLCASALATVRL